MFQRILVAFDQSEPAKRAIESVVELQRELGGKLAVVHVIDSAQAQTELAVATEAMLIELREQGEEILDAACDGVPSNVPIERFLFVGDPGESILSVAEEWRADLILIGSNSPGRLAHFSLGNTVDSVVRHAPCPVITVRAGAAMGHALAPADRGSPIVHENPYAGISVSPD